MQTRFSVTHNYSLASSQKKNRNYHQGFQQSFMILLHQFFPDLKNETDVLRQRDDTVWFRTSQSICWKGPATIPEETPYLLFLSSCHCPSNKWCGCKQQEIKDDSKHCENQIGQSSSCKLCRPQTTQQGCIGAPHSSEYNSTSKTI